MDAVGRRKTSPPADRRAADHGAGSGRHPGILAIPPHCPLSDTPNFKVGKTVDVDELWALPVGSVVLVDNYGAYTRFDFGYVRVSFGGNDTMTFNHNTKFDGKITVVRIGWRS